MLDLRMVDAGFSRKAEVYDAYCEAHPVIRWARGLIRAEVLRRIPAGGALLELNAGTGSDAAYFVEHGLRVHATDIAAGMLDAIRAKAARVSGVGFTVQQVSFTDLPQVTGGPYDLVFSNFGGLNCIPDLRVVTAALAGVLKPGGVVVFVVMPPFCLWELALLVRGHIRVAVRRWHPNGMLANVEGAGVRTWYHTPRTVRAAFGADYRLLHQQAISWFCPPSYMDRFPLRFPRLARGLMRADERLGASVPFRNGGDFILYTFQQHGR